MPLYSLECVLFYRSQAIEQAAEVRRLRLALEKERQISARRSADVKFLLGQLETLQHKFNTLWSEQLGD